MQIFFFHILKLSLTNGGSSGIICHNLVHKDKKRKGDPPMLKEKITNVYDINVSFKQKKDQTDLKYGRTPT